MSVSRKRDARLRRLKVYARASDRSLHGCCVFVPEIRLRGHWLQGWGFGIGQGIVLQLEPGRIVITPAGPGEE